MRRLLHLVHLLSNSVEGLTLDEMAEELGVDRRTVERMRDVIDEAFGPLEIHTDDRKKRFRIPEGLRRAYTRPVAAEVAALQIEVAAQRQKDAPHASQLESLLGKVKAALDDREKRRLDPDLEALARLQRGRVTAGPMVSSEPETLAAIQGAILCGSCVEFEYRSEDRDEYKWRRVIPYGLLHGPVAYLVGKIPDRDDEPVIFRLDRMQDVRSSNQLGLAPDSWDLDAWLEESFGIWREEPIDVVLRVRVAGVKRAMNWRFHPAQSLEPDGEELLVKFRSGGLREIAEHIFTWGGDIVIEEPERLREAMRERLALAKASLATSSDL